jgi:hypothetical protein
MRSQLVIARREPRIDYAKLAAVFGALAGSWALTYGLVRALFF